MIQNDNEISIDIQTYNTNKITCKHLQYKNIAYTILNYNRNFICNDDNENGKYRSVIISSSNNELLSLSHIKSMPNDHFTKKYPCLNNDLLINECIEGVFIQLFFVGESNSWEIATRSAIGGNYSFYRKNENKQTTNKSFYDMFLEALGCDDLQNVNFFKKNFCYNFILQHPENHIVLNIDKPSVYLVAVYEKNNGIGTEKMVKFINPDEFKHWECFVNTHILFPKTYEAELYHDIYEKYTTIYSECKIMGIMITHKKTGDHTCLQNIWYNTKKSACKNKSHLLYQFLCLLYSQKITVFLRYFPSYKLVFNKFRDQYETFIDGLHQSYLSKYVYKNNSIITSKYLHHIDKIHRNIYIHSLKNGYPVTITRSIIYDYARQLQPLQLYNLLSL